MKKLVSLLLCVAMLCAVVVVPTTTNEEAEASTFAFIYKEDIYFPEDPEAPEE